MRVLYFTCATLADLAQRVRVWHGLIAFLYAGWTWSTASCSVLSRSGFHGTLVVDVLRINLGQWSIEKVLVLIRVIVDFEELKACVGCIEISILRLAELMLFPYVMLIPPVRVGRQRVQPIVRHVNLLAYVIGQ